MAERENLPAAIAVQAIAVPTEQRGSLVARGLAAVVRNNADIAFNEDTLLCFSNLGLAYRLKVHELPEWAKHLRGKSIVNFLPSSATEQITAFLLVKEFDEEHFVFMATSMGTVKKTPLTSFADPLSDGVIRFGLDRGDHLIGVAITNGKCDVMLFSDAGKAVRFDEDDVRPMSKEVRGVRGMMLEDGQRVISMLVADSENYSVLTATENGFGKRTPIAEYTRRGRGTKGMIAIQTGERNGKVVGALLADDTNEVILSTSIDRIIRTCVSDIPETGRAAHGALLVQLQDNESLVGLSVNSCPIDASHLATLLDSVKQQIAVFVEGLFRLEGLLRQGLLYRYGEGVGVDIDKARSLFGEAAELAQLLFDESESMEGAELFKRGMRYRYGEDGVAMDDDEAALCFFDAADLDHVGAQLELAMLLIERGGWDDTADYWLNCSANLARLKLAEILLDGKITPSNFEVATDWLSRVAVHGAYRNRAMKMVAEKCLDGQLSAEDESYAQAWLDRVAKDARKLAADTSHPRAAHHAYEFAELYELGLGVEQDMGKAIHWYKQSAEQGLHAAHERLKELGIEWKAP